MALTASRLSGAPLTLDWAGLNHGSGKNQPSGLLSAGEAWLELKKRFESGEVGFYDTPWNGSLSEKEACVQLAKKIRETLKPQDVLFLGIGGSSLGPISLMNALAHLKSESPRFHFLENPDPTEWNLTLQKLNPEHTLLCIVTKSGTTFETLAQAMLALKWLGKERWTTNVVAMTDPAKGDLRAFASQYQIPALSIHPAIGGRFSVFSPVGIFPAALAGLNVDAFLEGAKAIRDYCEKTAPEKNALFITGLECLKHFSKRPIHIVMPYTTALRTVADWFVQLWAESLGKDGKGFTPLAALGATDQHSILQLMRDGPDDKVTFFLTVDNVPDEVKLPLTLPGVEFARFPAFDLLKNTSLHELLAVEYRAISLVLSKRDRPHFSWKLDRLDEKSVGALYFAMMVMTAWTGTAWRVNPFDQPGVEEGKIYIKDALKTGAQAGGADQPDWRTESSDENSAYERLRMRRNVNPFEES
jgi:glucose-6-phosphate isomerase